MGSESASESSMMFGARPQLVPKSSRTGGPSSTCIRLRASRYRNGRGTQTPRGGGPNGELGTPTKGRVEHLLECCREAHQGQRRTSIRNALRAGPRSPMRHDAAHKLPLGQDRMNKVQTFNTEGPHTSRNIVNVRNW